MYGLTYAAADTFDHIFINMNRFYMALIMVAPMVILMLFFMRGMYPNKKLNILLYSLSGLIFIMGFVFIRTQTFINDSQFLRSMIPHHSSAIVMCEESKITDSKIEKLCDSIIETQLSEIEQMQKIMERI
ncbi:DUF305 domain-containing protein [Candidatus Peregrinibacteria bacterium]|nr:DUF305 domain-containing protein [Candidatus Peregrinibacteria bacterium]